MPPKLTNPGNDVARADGVIAAIPVRYASTRFPGKALARIAGVPMIERVYRRAARARGLSAVVVLTDDERIAEIVRGFGGELQMTPTDCASGTDRIAWAARSWQANVILNVQGDEPLIEPESLETLADHLVRHPDDPVATLAFPAATEELGAPDVVKVVTNLDGYALYFSRAPVPYPRKRGAATVLRHIGVYGYQRTALLEIAAHDPTPLERTESLEQLRMLETGFSIKVLRARQAWPGVDTMEDLEKMEELLVEQPELARL